MNEQFTKTIDSLFAADKEMAELSNKLSRLEVIARAGWSEVEAVDCFRRELRGMISSVTAMLEKRERALLAMHKAKSNHETQTNLSNAGR